MVLERTRHNHLDVVILDEAHRTAWTGIATDLMAKILPRATYLGFTATPWRLSKRQGMADKFDALVSAPLPVELMAMGYLVKPRYFGITELDLAGVRVTAGDYNESDLSLVCNRPEVVQQAIAEYQRLAPGWAWAKWREIQGAIA